MSSEWESFGLISGELEVTCNECGDMECFSGDSPKEARREAKEAGWRCLKSGSEWRDECPRCREMSDNGY